MQCGAFEERLLDYQALDGIELREVDAHVAACAGCREFLEALAAVDRQLDQALGGASAPAGLRDAVLRQASTPRPSAIPELLDGIGWMGVLGLLGAAMFFASGFSLAWMFAAAVVFIVVAGGVSIRTFAGL